MNPATAKAEFEKFINQSGSTVSKLTPTGGIHLMLNFYKEIRADNCPIDEDGDMLLYQWGTYNWAKLLIFNLILRVNSSRQDLKEMMA